MAPGGKDPPKGAKWFNESWASLPKRNRRWRKSHQNKNLTAPCSQECENCENNSSADRRLTDRQLIVGIQIGDLSVYMLLLPSYRELRFSLGKRIALLSACWEQRFSFLKFFSDLRHPRLSAATFFSTVSVIDYPPSKKQKVSPR